MSMLDINEVRYCKECGAKISPNFKYCLHCGTKYEGSSFYNNGMNQERPTNQMEYQEQPMPIQQPVKEKPKVQKYCPKCGMETIPNDKYCIECGYKKPVVFSETFNDYVDAKFVSEYQEQSDESKIFWKILHILSIINIVLFGWIAAIIAVIGFVIMFFEFADGFPIFLVAGGYLFISNKIIKFCDKKKGK